MVMKRFALCAVLLLAACSTTTIPLVVELPLPEPLELPKIMAGELLCIASDAYKRLVQRDRLQHERIQTLRSIIEATHE